jgi:hypothetical protein
MISNDYVAADVLVIGRAQNIICGCSKGIFFDDGPTQSLRTLITDDVDQDA